MEPKHLKSLLIFIALLYLFFPRDLIPDFFGNGLGLVDDLSLMVALTYFYRKHLRDFAARTHGLSDHPGEGPGIISRFCRGAKRAAKAPGAGTSRFRPA